MQKQIHSIYMKEEIIVCVFVIAFSMCCVTNCSQSSQDTVPLLKKLNVSLMPFITLNLSVVSSLFFKIRKSNIMGSLWPFSYKPYLIPIPALLGKLNQGCFGEESRTYTHRRAYTVRWCLYSLPHFSYSQPFSSSWTRDGPMAQSLTLVKEI